MATPLGPFAPDDKSTTPHLTTALGVKLIADAEFGVAYAPSLSFEPLSTSTAVSGTVKGSLTAVTKAGIYTLFLCTSSTIIKINASGVPTVIGSGYNLPAGDKWSCCQMYDYAYFTNKNDGLLRYDVELGGAVSAVSGAPAARVIRPIFDVLMALDCNGDNKLMMNSDYDPTNWTSGVANNQPFPEATELVGIEALSAGTALIFQRDRIHPITRRGDALLFDKGTPILHEGPVSPWCIVPAHGAVYYIGTSGAKKATAAGVEPIGLGKVDRSLIVTLTNEELEQFEGAFDPLLEMVRWRYVENTPGFSSSGLDYYLRVNNFAQQTFATNTLQGIFTAASPGYTMEELDAFGTMDSVALNVRSLDDRFWYGTLPEIAAVDEDGLFGFFSGDSEAVTLDLATMDVGTNGLLTSLRPDTDYSATSVTSTGKPDRVGGAADSTSTGTQAASGRVPMRTRGRYHDMEIQIPAATGGADGWTYIRAIDDIVIRPGGPR